MNRCHILAVSLASLLCVLATKVHATVFCVHNGAELGSAIFSANANTLPDVIRLARGGTFVMTGNSNYSNADTSQNLYMSGGWDQECQLRVPNASNTVIDGVNQYNIFINAGGDVTFDAIRFHRLGNQTVTAHNITIRSSQFTGTLDTDYLGIDSRAGTVVLDSNVFNGKNVNLLTLDGTPEAPQIEWNVINNTFANAQEISGDYLRQGIGLIMAAPGYGANIHIVLANNIAWGNSSSGMYVYSHPLILATHNQWQSFTNEDNAPLENGSGGNSTANPQLDADLRPITPTSPAINSGTLSFPGGIGSRDADGRPRQIGSLPDRGAYESPADDSQIITVTTNADTGSCPSATHCSLRGALIAAAAATNDQRIEFSLSSCPQTILVNSALPSVIDQVTIDGYSQSGSSANTSELGSDARLCVILRGNYSNSSGLLADDPDSRLIVKGLAFENFGRTGIEISNGFGHVILGNQFGGHLTIGDDTSYLLFPSLRNILLVNESALTLVGGPDASQRNVIDGASLYGIGISGSSGSHNILNNLIGLEPDGTTPHGNAIGVVVQSKYNQIDYNTIAASTNEGLRIQGTAATYNHVYGNTIGMSAGTLPATGNGDAGIRIMSNATNNSIGTNAYGTIIANDIVGNGINGGTPAFAGIAVESGTGNRITGNRIHGNQGINIDLGADGPTANDPTDSDGGPNLLQNYPQALRIAHGDGRRMLKGALYITESQRIEAFGAEACGNEGRGDAAAVLSTGGRPLLVPVGGGIRDFTIDLDRGPGLGADHSCVISMTATSISSAGSAFNDNTSELSGCFVDDTIFAQDLDTPTGWSCAP